MRAVLTSSRQTKVGFSLGKDLHVQQIQHSFIMECENTLKDQDVGRIDGSSLAFPRMLFEGVDWYICFLPYELLVHVVGCEWKMRRLYPALISCSLSTRLSKSMASGASKSYSFLKAAADSSEVRGL